MKQTKKLTRLQREFLEKRNKDTEDVRVIEETKEYLKYVDKNGATITLYKS